MRLFLKKEKDYIYLIITTAFEVLDAVIMAVLAIMEVFPEPDTPWIISGTLLPLLRYASVFCFINVEKDFYIFSLEIDQHVMVRDITFIVLHLE